MFFLVFFSFIWCLLFPFFIASCNGSLRMTMDLDRLRLLRLDAVSLLRAAGVGFSDPDPVSFRSDSSTSAAFLHIWGGTAATTAQLLLHRHDLKKKKKKTAFLET